MRLSALVLLALLVPPSAHASWGLVGGMGRTTPKDGRAGKLEGPEGGIVAMADREAAMWRLTYDLYRNRSADASLEFYRARLSFRLGGMKYLAPYAGGGTGLGWYELPGGRRRLWVSDVHAGVLLAALDGASGFVSQLPCLSCMWNSASLNCRRCRAGKRRGVLPGASSPAKASWLYLGAEIEYRTARLSLSGWGGRVFAAAVW